MYLLGLDNGKAKYKRTGDGQLEVRVAVSCIKNEQKKKISSQNKLF